MSLPKASIIIVTYNNERDILVCLESVLAQDYPNFEIIVIDNASIDLTTSIIRRYHEIKMICQECNLGFASANNIGVKISSGQFLVFLNPDTRVDRAWLSNLLKPFHHGFKGLVTSKIINSYNNLINACGLQIHLCGLSYCNYLNSEPESIIGTFSVPAISGCSFATTREIWFELGGFDEKFFLYLEDADLSLRAQNLGYSCLCVTSSVLYHNYNSKLSSLKYYYLERNRLWLINKLFDKKKRKKLFFSLLLMETMTWGYALVKGPTFLEAKMKALKDGKMNDGKVHFRNEIENILTCKMPKTILPSFYSPILSIVDNIFRLNKLLLNKVCSGK